MLANMLLHPTAAQIAIFWILLSALVTVLPPTWRVSMFLRIVFIDLRNLFGGSVPTTPTNPALPAPAPVATVEVAPVVLDPPPPADSSGGSDPTTPRK